MSQRSLGVEYAKSWRAGTGGRELSRSFSLSEASGLIMALIRDVMDLLPLSVVGRGSLELILSSVATAAFPSRGEDAIEDAIEDARDGVVLAECEGCSRKDGWLSAGQYKADPGSMRGAVQGSSGGQLAIRYLLSI